jgi:uncharacterized protein (TIGR02147 family)
MKKLIDVFTYSDYKQFLRDFYIAAKREFPGFSYKVWSDRAGFSSASFIKLIIEGQRSLTEQSAAQVARSTGLKGKSATYFIHLVKYAKSGVLEEKIRQFGILERYRSGGTARTLDRNEYRFIENWYIPLLAEMTELPDFTPNEQWIARTSLFPLRPKQIKNALDFLITAGYLQKEKDGSYRKVDQIIQGEAGPINDAMALSVRRYHTDMFKLAEKAIVELPIDERHVSNTTLSLSEKSYRESLERIKQLRSELLAIASKDNSSDRIYQLSTIFFPLTNNAEAKQKKRSQNTDISKC